ncbi:MAG: iron ABC transporter permease [Bacteroidota bacterium]|nr:iron ABC transporter permease [Bacteroidota bacterium]
MKKNLVIFSTLTISLLGVFVADLFWGSVHIPVKNILQALLWGNGGKEEWTLIVLDFRLPKALTAVLAGSALSISGLQMQTMFRNPLAGPYTLGISSGASLGVAFVLLGFSSVLGFHLDGIAANWVIVISAWLGAGAVLLLIFLVSLRINDIMTILILGIMFGSVSTAIVSVLQYFSNEVLLKSFLVWTMGSLGNVSGTHLWVLLPSVGIGLIISLLTIKMLNLMLLGENYARSMGLNVNLARFLIFFSTSILAGSITAFCGPIGFIGIAVPHICRMLFKTSDQKVLLFACIVVGAMLMLVSDLISQIPGSGMVLPINTVTALLGIPVVIWIIFRNQRISSI